MNNQPKSHQGLFLSTSKPTLQAVLFPNTSVPYSWRISITSLSSKQHCLRNKTKYFQTKQTCSKRKVQEKPGEKPHHRNASHGVAGSTLQSQHWLPCVWVLTHWSLKAKPEGKQPNKIRDRKKRVVEKLLLLLLSLSAGTSQAQQSKSKRASFRFKDS